MYDIIEYYRSKIIALNFKIFGPAILEIVYCIPLGCQRKRECCIVETCMAANDEMRADKTVAVLQVQRRVDDRRHGVGLYRNPLTRIVLSIVLMSL